MADRVAPACFLLVLLLVKALAAPAHIASVLHANGASTTGYIIANSVFHYCHHHLGLSLQQVQLPAKPQRRNPVGNHD